MKYKKFLIIPALILFYIFFVVDFIVGFNPVAYLPSSSVARGTGGEIIIIGEAVTVYVSRPYLFGLFRLPVYSNYLGYIGNFHEMFFASMAILTLIFMFIEWRNRKKTGWRKKKMRRKIRKKKFDMKKLAKVFGMGVLFGFVTYVLSNDGGVSVGLGLLLMYLEYKLE